LPAFPQNKNKKTKKNAFASWILDVHFAPTVSHLVGLSQIWIRISELAIGISTTMCLKILTKKSEGKRKRKKKPQQSATYDAMMHYA
jgi:hypothetical protein